MRVPSTIARPGRRQPQQARAAQRQASFLDVAARLIGERGYEAVTMTAVAERSGTSIGALYDYFPDKLALAQALAAKYAKEADEHWKKLLGASLISDEDDLADLLVEGAMAFVLERPAYLPLFGSPWISFRSPSARHHLRKAFADALLQSKPGLKSGRAFTKAQVLVELIKALLSVYKQIAPGNRSSVTADFKRLVRFYINE